MRPINLTSKSYKHIMDELFEGMYVTDRDRKVIYWNAGAERISGHLAIDIVGKRYCRDFLMHVDRSGERLCDTACPIAGSLVEGETQVVEAFIHHKEGHRVPVSIRTVPLSDKEGKIIGVAELFSDNTPRESLAKELADVKEMATVDGLTGLRNRAYGEIALNSRLTELSAGGLSFGLLFLDIDHFKVVNDTYGHDVGDLVLKMVAKTLLNNTRDTDIVIRWGGEEILAVLVGPNMEAKLPKIAEKLRVLISQSMLTMEEGTNIRVTVSVGATLAQTGDTVDSLVRRGDHLMYECKKAGRNCVRVGV